MDIKKKRIKVIKVTVILGVTLPILFALMSDPKSNDGIVVMFFIVAAMISQWASIYIKNQHAIHAVFIISHLTTYLLLGWIIARLIYPNKKISNKAEMPQD